MLCPTIAFRAPFGVGVGVFVHVWEIVETQAAVVFSARRGAPIQVIFVRRRGDVHTIIGTRGGRATIDCSFLNGAVFATILTLGVHSVTRYDRCVFSRRCAAIDVDTTKPPLAF